MKKAAIQDFWRKLDDSPKAACGVASLKQLSHQGTELEFESGGIFAVVGANGAGKSSFFTFLTDP